MFYKRYFVYFLSNYTNTYLYIGVTNNLQKRIYQHKTKAVDGFTRKYNINKLVYWEEYGDSRETIVREKYLKGKKRSFKNKLIELKNPEYKDLYSTIE